MEQSPEAVGNNLGLQIVPGSTLFFTSVDRLGAGIGTVPSVY